MTIKKLFSIIQERREKMPKNSYVASLFRAGKNKIIQKIGEEATEVIVASKGTSKKRIISEIADLYFHILILLEALKLTPDDILNELEKRHRSK